MPLTIDEQKKIINNSINNLKERMIELDLKKDYDEYARKLKMFYDSLIKVGFSETESMTLLCKTLDGINKGGK